jgi:FtsP/CotA-like multicopper oxidase with cupredoxin domain
MEFKRQGGESTVNGRTWADVINSGFTLLEAHPGLSDVEIWTFKNDSNGWFHPVHVHLVDFKTATGGLRHRTNAAPRTSCTSARVRPCA